MGAAAAAGAAPAAAGAAAAGALGLSFNCIISPSLYIMIIILVKLGPHLLPEKREKKATST
jgi:hypothetical protein